MSLKSISQNLKSALSVPLEAMGVIAAKSDGLEKVAKLSVTIIDGAQNIFSHYGSSSILAVTVVFRGKLKVVADVISGLNFINRMADWVCNEPGKNKPFWQAEAKTSKEKVILYTKVVSRAFLTGAHFIDFAKLMDAFGLIRLGKVSSTTFGRVPVINLAKDSLVVVASVFMITSNAASLTTSVPRYNAARKRCDQWKTIGGALEGKRSAKDIRKMERQLANKCLTKVRHYEREGNEAKADKWRAHLDPDSGDGTNPPVLAGAEGEKLKEYAQGKLHNAIARAEKKRQDDEQALEYVRRVLRARGVDPASDEGRAALARPEAVLAAAEAALNVLNSFDFDNDEHIHQYVDHQYQVFKADETNAFRKVTKQWLGIAYDVAKIAIITFGTLGLALGLASFQWAMTIFTIALVTNGLGVIKLLYDELYAKKIAKAPPLLAAVV